MGSKRSNLFGAVAMGALLAGSGSAAMANEGDPASRIGQLLSDIETQRQRLDEQARQLADDRDRLRAQEDELLRLRSTLAEEKSGSAAKPATTAQTEAPTGGSPQTASSAKPTDAGAAQKPTAARAEPAPAEMARSGMGRRGKNTFADTAPDTVLPKGDLQVAGAQTEPFREEEREPARSRETLRDVVRRALAPTLTAQTEVGERPEENQDDIDIAVIADRGGVLTPRGTLVVDPAISYTHSSVNRFFFDGVEIVDALLIGILEAQDIDRDSFISSLGLRYGLTKRMEISARTSWTYRDDRTDAQAVDATGTRNIKELDGKGFGDIDFGLNYQLNRPKGNFPYFVANARFKSNTGDGPFDVARDLQTGLEKELPTGSGFWTIEPSFTMIYPSDPAVLFANIGYQYTVKDTIDKTILDRTVQTQIEGTGDLNNDGIINVAGDPSLGPTEVPIAFKDERTVRRVGEVNPGDALSLSVGMGLGLNDSVSLSFGYEHSWVFGTETEQFVDFYENGVFQANESGRVFSQSSDAQVGSLLMGASVNISENVGFNFNVAVGVTSDSPDVQISLRAPFSWELFTK